MSGAKEKGMFGSEPYLDVNREERFYCFLLGHALLVSPHVRASFTALAQPHVALDANTLEVYVEMAALRDYWIVLGDPLEYSEETHARRRAVLEHLLSCCTLSSELIDQQDFFWTGKGDARKLWSPGRWRLPKESSEELPYAVLQNLWNLKWAMNAKPDMLLMSPGAALIVEAKVESGEGSYGGKQGSEGVSKRGARAEAEVFTAKQKDIQGLIGKLMRATIPAFRDVRISNATLGLPGREDAGEAFDFTWEQVRVLCDTDEVDAFTRAAFGALLDRSK
jgi:hypothetical protein